MPRLLKLSLFVPAAVGVLALTGCSELKQGFEEGKREAIVETVGKTAIQQAAGVTINGELSCGTVQSGSGSINCTGSTSDGKPVTLTGTIAEAAQVTKSDWVRGEFVATVDGRDVLRRTCLGSC